MPDGEHPIDAYIIQLAQRLHLPDAERDQVLTEVRGHLEERAGALHETGISEQQAERQAVHAFGPVRRIRRELQASHPIAWGKRHWIVGMVTGAGVACALWLVATVPVMTYYFYAQLQSGSPPIPTMLWHMAISSLLADYPLYLLLGWLGWLWALPFLVLYLVLPFVWGRRAQHWWVPGLAYGLGTWLPAVPELVFVTVTLMMKFADVGILLGPAAWMPLPYVLGTSYVGFSALALPLALVASFVGWLWRERSVSALGRVQTA